MRIALASVLVAVLAAGATAQPGGPLTVTVTDVVSGASFALDTSAQAQTGAAGLELTARQMNRDAGAVSVRILELELRDTTGEDRAVDLDVTLATDLAGWRWHHDINSAEPIDPAAQFAERRYPLAVITSDTGGLALAIAPEQPVIYELRGNAGGLTLHTQLGLTPLGTGELRSAAQVRVYLFPVDPRWGMRDALATYYALFPPAFERRAMDEGQWLFAFENTRLPNPSHYAYHEGGPEGWEYDEEHGIGTYPYTEVSSRTVYMHRLPADRQDALAAWEEYKSAQELSAAEWSMRGGAIDLEVARTGNRSLRCAKDDPAEWVGASQDVMVNQRERGPVTISGWLRAQDVTGERDREISLYGDVLLQSGEWLFGQIASFETGTHDWRQASHTIEAAQPVQMVRLHCLFRAGHTGTVWFDDIEVFDGARPGVNLALNPSFEEVGINPDIAAIEAYSVHERDGHPAFSITTNVGSDVAPETPMKLLRFTLNPSPYLQRAAGAELPPGPRSIQNYVNMIESIPALDGAYIDSVSAWATRYLDFRREAFGVVRHSFTYDPQTKQVVAPGKHYTYDYLAELGNALHPRGKWVFTNIHNTMDTFLLYAVSDVPGIESSITDHERFAYIRSASYQKPALLLNFLNLQGFEVRAKHDLHWRMAVLYGLYPSIGRRCDEAYELYGDLYRRFMPSLKRISAAGWEPVTYALAEPAGPYIERFGDSTSGLFFTVYNGSAEDYAGTLTMDARLIPGLVACDTTTGWIAPVQVVEDRATARVHLPAGEVAVIQVGTPAQLAQTAQAEIAGIVTDLRRLEAEAPENLAARVRALRGRIIGMNDLPPAPLSRATVEDLVALHNDASITARTWTGETPGQALLRALMLRERIESAARGPVALAVTGAAVQGESGAVSLQVGGEVTPDAVFLMRDSQGLRVIDTQFQWPAEGYGDGLIDLIALGVGESPGAVLRTLRFRPAIEVGLTTEQPSAVSVERLLTARCHNNTSESRTLRLRVEAPAPWSVTPAQCEVEAPAGGVAEAQFRVRGPEGRVEMVPLRVVAEGGPKEIAAETSALCGRPVALDPNLARAEGVQVSVDSSYDGYGPAPLTDGLMWPDGVHWTQRAWASAESSADHWIELAWPQPVELTRVIVYWNLEDGRLYASRQVRVETLVGDSWTPIAAATPEPTEAASALVFSPTRTTRLRIVQPAGMGPVARPNIMWVTEIEAG